MKLNKTFGRAAATLVATAMLASMAMPAYAETAIGAPGAVQEQIKITKRLVMPEGVTTPVGKTFTFNIVGASGSGTITTGTDNSVFDVKTAPEGAGAVVVDNAGTATIADTTRTPINGEDGQPTGNVYVDATATLNLPTTDYLDAGVYKYTITEDAVNVGSNEDYVDHTTALDLYLFVEHVDTDSDEVLDDYKITGAVIYPKDAAANNSGKSDIYTNYYMLDASGESKVGSLKIEKVIDGTMASLNDEFTFTITGLDMSKTYNTSDRDVKLGKVGEGTVNTVTLNGGEDLIIYGVDAKEDYVVKENANDKGYSISAVVTNDKDEVLEDDVNYTSADSEELAQVATNGVTVDVNVDKQTDVTFTNTRDAVSPTGLVMDIAPYVLLVVAAAAGCFIFMRKRRED